MDHLKIANTMADAAHKKAQKKPKPEAESEEKAMPGKMAKKSLKPFPKKNG